MAKRTARTLDQDRSEASPYNRRPARKAGNSEAARPGSRPRSRGTSSSDQREADKKATAAFSAFVADRRARWNWIDK
jgi:hypothetical protein